jgi:DNA-binding MarR family transcriptional regulator
VGERNDPVVTGAAEDDDAADSVGAAAKSFYFALRTAMDTVLRPFDLGSTQYYVLYVLADEGPTAQRDLGRRLQIERTTLSGIVSTLVRKGLIEQSPNLEDQRQRSLGLTAAGTALWGEIPDPRSVIRELAFGRADPEDLANARRVLIAATAALNAHVAEAGAQARRR